MPARLDPKILDKVAKAKNKSSQYIREQVSRLAHRKAIASEAALVLMARDLGISTNAALRKLEPHVQQQVRESARGESVSVSTTSVSPSEFARKAVGSRKVARPRRDSTGRSSGKIGKLLSSKLHPELGMAYQQVLLDLADSKRLSLRGTANEMREVMSDVLHLMAPDDKVKVQKWFVLEPNTTGPTRSQRLRFIFESKHSGLNKNAAAAGLDLVEQLVTKLTIAVYQRSNRATHTQRNRKELRRILSYMNPVIEDLLDD